MNSQTGEPSQDRPYEAVGKRICWVRDILGVTQHEAARLCEVSIGSWAKWESGKQAPDWRPIAALCDKSGASLDYILRGRLDQVLTVDFLGELLRTRPEERERMLRMREPLPKQRRTKGRPYRAYSKPKKAE